jgi:hypothetical protein
MSLHERTHPGLGTKWTASVARLALLSVVLVSATETEAGPPQAVRAACSGDAQRLCAAVLGDPKAQPACMREHRAELSAGCKAAIAQWRGGAGGGPQVSRGEGTEVTSGPNRRARCAAYVQDYSFHAGSAWKINGGRAALQRCMHGQAIGF